ncbi:hypothetical protein [Argonema galeatum]|uniref:hypothetical protein n=1 Tax=Argonema galeatum TaxID=2942762 RepID=UPI002011DA91|nr:hypothetical protein [Argonema galeatum]MCL1463619.1 hypothetical protein [Argonema galeatum A003/A1]
MREQDIKTIRAFLIALSQLESPLDESIQKQLNQLGEELATDVEEAIENLRKLIYKHDFLKTLYQPALESLQLAYQAQSRNKCILPSDSEPEGENLELENFSLPTDSLKLIKQIFESNNSVKITQGIQQQLQSPNQNLSPAEIVSDELPSSTESKYPHAWVYMFC